MSDNPYAAPTTTSPAAAADYRIEKQYDYRPLGTLLTLITVIMLGICMAFLAISCIDTFGALTFATFTDPSADVESELEMGLIYAQLGLGILAAIAFLIEGILVCMFLYRANANLRALGTLRLQHTPGWCAGYWFIPILNLYKPYQVTKEIDRASQRPGGEDWTTPGVQRQFIAVVVDGMVGRPNRHQHRIAIGNIWSGYRRHGYPPDVDVNAVHRHVWLLPDPHFPQDPGCSGQASASHSSSLPGMPPADLFTV